MRAAAAIALLVAGLSPAAGANQANDLTARAIALVSKLGAGQFAAATADFDAKMSEVLPAPALEAVWTKLVGQLGPFRSTGRALIADKSGGYDIVLVTCRFEKDAVDAKVVFDSKGKVAGLFFVPVQVPWSPPAYVDAKSVREEPLRIGREPQLDAKLALPAGEGPFPAVVVVHGSGPVDMDGSVGAIQVYRDLAWGLASRGIAVLRFHKRTYQHPQSLAAEAKTLTVEGEVVADAVAAAELLRGRAEIDARRVYVLGHSLGAELVPTIAERLPWLAGGIAMAGRTRPFGDVVVAQLEHITGLDGVVDEKETQLIADAKRFRDQVSSPSLKPDENVSLMGSNTPGAYWIDLRDRDAIAIAKRVATPLLFLQGGRDYQVTKADFAGWKAGLAKRPKTRFRLFAKLNHLFVAGKGVSGPAEYGVPGHVDRAVIEDIARWVRAGGPGKR